MANLCGDGFDVGERIGQADGPAGDGNGHIKKRNADGGAAALVAADFPGESGDEFRARGMVFHVSGIGFRIGQDFSRGIDDSDAGTGGLTFLSGNVAERVSAVGFDTMGEELRLLDEIAFNFGAQ